MWCRSCHREVAAIPNANGDKDCPFCGDGIVRYRTEIDDQGEYKLRADEPHVKVGLKSNDGKKTKSSTGSFKSLSELSINQSELTRSTTNQVEFSGERLSSPTHSRGLVHWINFAGFFVLVFLVGQILTVSSFLVGHYGAWALGQLFVSTGIAVALWMVIRANAKLFQENNRLHRLTQKLLVGQNSAHRLSRSPSKSSSPNLSKTRRRQIANSND